MIYGYTLWRDVFPHLLKELPLNAIRNINDYNKMSVLPKENDFLFFLRFGKGDRKLQQQFYEQGYQMYPNPTFSLFLSQKDYLKEIDEMTRYPLQRVYYDSLYDVKRLPDFSPHLVLKVGNYHCGENKWKLDARSPVPLLKYKLRKEPLLIEEFVPDARSIRIAFVGDPNNMNNAYIVEHVNSTEAANNPNTSWIKNISPIETVYLYDERQNLNIPHIDALIDETKQIALRYQTDLLGVDWVVSPTKTGLLEVNDMIGIPDDERVCKMFQNHMLNICETYLNQQKI